MTSPFDLNPGDLPPHLRDLFKAQQEQREAVLDRMEAAEIANRQLLLDMAWLVCSCRKWYDRAEPDVPPQSGCTVHGNVMVTRSGLVL
jgi:hypothetical protein